MEKLMKATGIIRRVDELGRIVIPKEIRRTHKIREGTPLEIFSGDSGELMLKKYSPILVLQDICADAIKSVFDVLEVDTFICDKDCVLCVEGQGVVKKEFLHNPISMELENIIENRKSIIFNKNEGAKLIGLIKNDQIKFSSIIVVPICALGDTYGAIVALSNNNFSNSEVKILQTFANFISLQIS